MVLPFIAVSTSLGLMALPPGMFSVAGTMAVTLIGAPRRARAPVAAMTAAPPLMSCFMVTMLADGLSEMPPVSKVMPLPIRPRPGSSPPPRWRSTISLAG